MFISLPPTGLTLTPGKLLCVGRNYAEHVREMGDVAELPSEPVVFLKPATALVGSGGEVCIPRQSQEVHHEVELVAVIGRGGKNIPEGEALEHVGAYALGLDMTARDLQRRAKEQRAPWSVAKGFDSFAPLGPLTAADEVPDPQALSLQLAVNGEVRQAGHARDMIFPVARLVSYLSHIFTLEPGDLIYTGTPEGVGAVCDGDELEATASLGGEPALEPLRVVVRAED
jgi:2-keto-4-pentenoate hydratase/2-oxohepta-3-ene-1,7-dioic acid hydratase in catechol pathway